MDFADLVTARLPLIVVVVVGLSALLLMVVFRSLLIPVKAALLNPLSLGAALSAITQVFQHGLMHLFGVGVAAVRMARPAAPARGCRTRGTRRPARPSRDH